MLAQVVHQQDLPQVLFGCSAQHAVHGAQERGPSFIMETDNDAGRRQGLFVLLLKTPDEWDTRSHLQHSSFMTLPLHLCASAVALTRDDEPLAVSDALICPR